MVAMPCRNRVVNFAAWKAVFDVLDVERVLAGEYRFLESPPS
jgi:hypothetical protein